ncbi:RHS repeat-associated core domain-containing protein [Pseudomonas sp.]|uniref:RHS repeat-associated core domain-containing protein n=1 Tax=Pseudomonas sp. TaxID=306 RepID=UPI0028AABA52|nr:RHS repeat-associated core domain-containing protein [Pseudomonas sp.]
MIDSAILRPLIYDAYGHSSSAGGDAPLLGFNAELLSPLNLYLLGNGARAYSARIRRFLNPDALSPFGYGGTNAYAYCSGDPINRIDPTGQSWKKIRSVILGREGRVVASANGMSGVTGGSSGQLSKAALENIGKMENGRHFVGVMKVSDKRIDLAISNQLGHVGSDVEKRLPKGVTYQIGSGMKAVSIPVPLEGLHEIGRRAGGEPFDITGHAMMVKMLSGREKDYVGFSGLKRGETTLRLKWTSRTLNPRHASFMTRRHLGIPGQGRDYILHPSYQQKIIRQFERSGFEVITDR